MKFHFKFFTSNKNRVEQLVDAFYEAVNPKEPTMYTTHLVAGYLKELYDMLIKPIWKDLIIDSEITLVALPDKVNSFQVFENGTKNY